MKKARTQKTTRIAKILATVLACVFAWTALLHLGFAVCIVQLERDSALELYRQESLSPGGASESFEEKEQHIQEEFEDDSWAFQIAIGKTDKATTVILVIALVALAGFTTYPVVKTYQKLKKAKA